MTTPILLRTADIALHYQVAPGSVRRWACEDQWTPYGPRHDRLWDLWQAQASYDKRHPDLRLTSTERTVCHSA